MSRQACGLKWFLFSEKKIIILWFHLAPWIMSFAGVTVPASVTIYWPSHLFDNYFLKWLLLVLVGMYAPIWIRLQKVLYFNTSSCSLSKTLLRSVRNMVLVTFLCLGKIISLVVIGPFTSLTDCPVCLSLPSILLGHLCQFSYASLWVCVCVFCILHLNIRFTLVL